ncbi:MAG: hypothetical protein ABII12_12150 [Planctomycetota bacterium]
MDDAGATYETLNNRLMYYEVYENMTLLERRDYEYDNRGNPTYIVRKLESEAMYHGYTLEYNKKLSQKGSFGRYNIHGRIVKGAMDGQDET